MSKAPFGPFRQIEPVPFEILLYRKRLIATYRPSFFEHLSAIFIATICYFTNKSLTGTIVTFSGLIVSLNVLIILSSSKTLSGLGVGYV